MSRAGQLRRWLPVVAWGGVISLFSTGYFTGESTGKLLLPILGTLFPRATPAELLAMHRFVRKLGHFTEYLILSVLLYRALRAGRRWNLRAAATAIVVAGLYAVADEFHQLFVPGRTAAASDCLIDVSGAAAGQGLLAVLGRVLRT
ncbi:MAG: VanZ family protein [Deltaproteobacteria bacterium]|nr:MAG: VanZ family protein [Deltaproteobacteria bacterium]